MAFIENMERQCQALRDAVHMQQLSINTLQKEAVARREEATALLECLSDAGVLRPATFFSTLHRRRFAAARELDRTGTSVGFEDAMRLETAALQIGLFAGPTAVCATCATSRNVGRAVSVAWPSLSAMCSISVYVCGGKDARGNSMSSVERFNHRASIWEPLPSMSNQRHCACAGVVGGKVYICGGTDGKTVLRSVERFDPGGTTWAEIAPMLRERTRACAGVIANRLYICGGLSTTNLSLRSAEYFNLAAEAWQALPPMTTERAWASAGVLQGLLYVCGGEGFEDQYLSTAECFDQSMQGWRPVASMLEARAGAPAASVGSKLYVCGGFGDLGQVISTVVCFDPDSDSWEAVGRTPALRSGVAATAAAGQLVLFGGYESCGPVNDVQRFDPNAPTMMSARGVSSPTAWAVLPAMNMRRENAAATSSLG